MMKYPRLEQLGIEVHHEPIPHVKSDELTRALGSFGTYFDQLFGEQTCSVDGPYASDVEAVLERMASGRATGSQLVFD